MIMLMICMRVNCAYGQPQPPTREYELKAAWLYQLGNTLIEWDNTVGDEFVIGVFGEFPKDFRRQLARVERRRIQDRPVRIKQYKTLKDFKAQDRPSILFISSEGRGANMQQRLRKALNTVGNYSVLIVGDKDDIDSGTAISFKVDQQRRLILRRNDAALQAYGVSLKNPEIWRKLIKQSSVETVERVDPLIPTSSRTDPSQ
jgi:hypothetical protein